MWDNIYHEPLTSSVLFKYNIKINEHEYQISLLFAKKKRMSLEVLFKFLFKKHLSQILFEKSYINFWVVLVTR